MTKFLKKPHCPLDGGELVGRDYGEPGRHRFVVLCSRCHQSSMVAVSQSHELTWECYRDIGYERAAAHLGKPSTPYILL